MIKKISKITLILIVVMILLSILLSVLVRLPAVQNFVLKKVTNYISDNSKATVNIGSFSWNMVDDITLREFYLGNKKGDTLVFVRNLQVDMSYWSILKKELVANEIAINDATIHLQIDKEGKLDLTELFKKENSENKKIDTTVTTSPKWVTKLKKLTVINTSFELIDNKNKSRIEAKLPALIVAADKLDFKNQLIALRTISIQSPSVAITQIDTTQKTHTDTTAFHFLPKNMQLTWGSLLIENGQFSMHKNYKAPLADGRIDFNHLKVSAINLAATDGALASDSLKTIIKKLSAKEKSGLELVSASTKLLTSLTTTRCQDLQLTTANSFLSDELSFTYKSYDDFNYFLNKVAIQANLKASTVALKDLAYFIKGIENINHNKIKIAGILKGKISGLDGKNLVLSTGNNTELRGDFFTSGLPKLSETFLNLRLKSLTTTVNDIHRIAPMAKLPDNMYKLGTIRFNGDLDGFISDIVAKGSLQTDLGSASSDLNLKYNFNNQASVYSGNLNLNYFDLGKWFSDTSLGKVSFTAKVDGKGLKLENLDTKLTGAIQSFEFRKYNYQNIIIDGRVKGKSFEGALKISDPNLDMDFNGKADLAGVTPTYKFNADIQNISLYNLNLSKNNISIKGNINADFAGKNIDDLEGILAIQELTLTRDDEVQTIRETTLDAHEDNNGLKTIRIESDALEASVSGRFSLLTLPKLIKSKFNSAVYLIEDTASFKKQAFSFDIRIYDSLPFLKIIDPKILLVRNSFLRGTANSETNTLELSGNIPEFIYGKYKLKNTAITSSVNNEHTTANVTINKLYVSDSLLLDTIALSLTDLQNGYTLNLQSRDRQNFNRINANLDLYPSADILKMNFRETTIWLGGKEWTIEDNNKIIVQRKKIDLENLVFSAGDQSITASSFLSKDSASSIRISLKETSLKGFMAIFSTKASSIDATINGNLDVQNIFEKPLILGTINLRDILLGEINLGSLTLRSLLNNNLNRVDLSADLNGEKSDITIDGFYSLDAKNPLLNIEAKIKKGDLQFLNFPFFEKYVNKTSGTFTGDVKVVGPIKKLQLGGNIHINEADVVVSYLQTRYKLQNEDIVLNPSGYIDIGKITLTDIKNNTAVGEGRIYHDNLKKFTLQLSVTTKEMQFLNTTAKDNSTFYGTIFGSGTVIFGGTIPQVDIRAYARVNEGTHVYIPINSNFETNGYSFYKFTNKRLDSLRAVGKSDKIFTKGVNFTADIDVSPVAELDIILDQTSGDILTSRGSGNIKIDLSRNGDFGIYGLYEIERGNYVFTLQNIINKRFVLAKGGSILFNGDIKKAQVNAEAFYQVRTSTYDIIYDPQQSSSLSSEVEARAKNRMVTRLLLKLNGVLERPDVSFDIQPVDPDPVIKTILDNRLQIVKSTESELNKQVFGLLVMNRYLPLNTNGSSTTGSFVSGSVTNTVSEFLSSQLSQYASSFFENMNIKDFDVNLNFRQYDQQSNNTSAPVLQSSFDTRRELQLALTKRFLNNRLSINVGGNVDFGDRYTYDNTSGTYVNNPNSYVNGDAQIEYSLTKSGNLKIKAFNKIDYDNFNLRNRNKTGIGLSFRQDFDNLKDLFRIKNKNKKNQKTTQEKAPPKPEDEIQSIPQDSIPPL